MMELTHRRLGRGLDCDADWNLCRFPPIFSVVSFYSVAVIFVFVKFVQERVICQFTYLCETPLDCKHVCVYTYMYTLCVSFLFC